MRGRQIYTLRCKYRNFKLDIIAMEGGINLETNNVKLLSVKAVCDMLGISMRNAYTMFHRKDFPAIKLGNRLYVRENTFFLWLAKMEQMRA